MVGDLLDGSLEVQALVGNIHYLRQDQKNHVHDFHNMRTVGLATAEASSVLFLLREEHR